MCGRLNCYCKYSSYSDRIAKKLKEEPPQWAEPHKFRPSPNKAPTTYVPVLYKGDSGEFLVRPMKWGISLPHVPSLVHNVRIETLSTSKFFSKLLDRHQTCAVLCDGFYEWKGKKPFFFFDGQTGFDESTLGEWSEEVWIQNGPPVMALAGVYDGGEEYSCSVVTREATKTSQVHHRITVLLSDKEEILSWLSPSPPVHVKLNQLKAVTNEALSYYEVSDRVNSSKYQGNDCHVPKSKTLSSGPLDQWFSHSKESSKIPVPNSQETSEKCTKRKSQTDPPTQRKKSAAGTPKKSGSSSSPAKNKSGGPLDKWFSKTKKPPE